MSKTNIEIRKNNRRNIILNIIRSRVKVSRYDIKKISRLSMTTVLAVVEELLREGIIIESEIGESTGGRRPIYLQINPSAYYIIGIEFYAEKLFCVVIDFMGDTVYSKEYVIGSSESSAEGILALLKQAVHTVLDNCSISQDKLLGIGVGSPGYVDAETGVLRFYAHQSKWNNIHIKDELEKEFGLTAYVDNNSTATALAFKWMYPDNNYNNLALLTIRSGIRLSLFVNNQLLCGSSNTAGEIGHIPIPGSTRRCGCGKKGCLDSEASNKAIHTKILEGILHNRFNDMYKLVDGDISKITIETFVKSCLLEHPDSMELLEEVCNYIALALSTVVNLINPSKIVVSGPISKIGPKFLQCLNDKLNKYSIFVGMENLKLELSNDIEYLNTIGAAMIVMEKTFICEPEFEEF